MKQLFLCFWAYASCHVTVCNKPWTVNPCKQAHSLFFLKVGNLRWYSSPQPRFLPRYGLWGDHHSWSLDQRLPNFPRVHSDSFCSFKNCHHFSWQNVRGIALTRNSFYPQRDVKSLLHFKNDTDHVIAVVVGRPCLEERTPDRLTVSKQDYLPWLQETVPRLDRGQDCHHFQLLYDCLLPFGHDLVQRVIVHSFTEEKQGLLRHVHYHAPEATVLVSVKWCVHVDVDYFGLEGFNFPWGIFWARELWSRSDTRGSCQTESACQPWHGLRGPSAAFWSVCQTSVNLRTEDALSAFLRFSEGADSTSLLRRFPLPAPRLSQQCLLQSKCQTLTVSSQVGLPELYR